MSDGSANSGGGGGAADAYIGSLISLTSKSEIRYEGILYTVDTANSNIALQDVRSYGTEGRKKDGPQIPSGDKVYDYIIFRGSDIKDLQVRSSPLVRPTTHAGLHQDPAIISSQSQLKPQPQPPPQLQPQPLSQPPPPPQLQTPVLPEPHLPLPPAPPGNLVEGVNPYSGISTSFRGNLPLVYPPGTSFGPWAVPSSVNGNLGMPTYWPGYYRHAAMVSHLQHSGAPFQTMLPSVPRYLAQNQLPTQFTTTDTQEESTVPAVSQAAQQSLPVGSSKDSLVTATMNQIAAPLLQPNLSTIVTQDLLLTTTSNPVDVTVPHTMSSTFTSVQTRLLLPETAKNLPILPVIIPTENKAPLVSSPGLSLVAPPVQTSEFVDDHLLTSRISSLVSEKCSDSSKLCFSQSLDDSSIANSEPLISTLPPLSTQHLGASNQPLLPLPVSQVHKSQGREANGSGTAGYMRRGRGRGRGIAVNDSQKPFIEDFDFSAMNEKFNKDEVWGELLKCEKVDTEDNLVDDYYDEEEASKMPVYVKDNFFDSLSCDAFGRGGPGERPKFSEQRKMNTETFGSYSVRPRISHGGRGGYRGGSRGGFYRSRNGGSDQGRNLARSSAF